MLSNSEENHLKAIYSITLHQSKGASTNSVAKKLETKASSVTDMIKKLADKGLVIYKPYQGASLTGTGQTAALKVIRKHRLWETFLCEKLHFSWDEVHEIAEQLEHIQSPKLTERLNEFLGFPAFDPHGDPIPDANGKFTERDVQKMVSELEIGESGVVVGIQDSSSEFLRFCDQHGIVLGAEFSVKDRYSYDGTIELLLGTKAVIISEKISNNICAKPH
ncbi:MAG: DtxR family Mn-dependent transcriptional regulator [Luteibaculaceae bacterium]|jgi:DtxR family Mn-dependent transcriptional regulator